MSRTPDEPLRRLFHRITSLRHHDNVDAAYECDSGVDRCHECAADFDALDRAQARTAVPEIDVDTLTAVLYDWMPDGADVSVGFDGAGRHLTGGDLARYIFERAAEYAATAPQEPE